MESTMGKYGDKLTDWLNEQAWWQELKSKWEELDPQSRLYLKLAGGGILLVVLLLIILNFIWGAHRLRDDVSTKSELLAYVNRSNDEMRRLKETSTNLSGAASNDPWPAYFQQVAGGAAVPTDGFAVSDPKPGAASDVSKEALYDITVKHANIRQIVKFVQSLETGTRPVKVRDLAIDTIQDGSGYLDATLAVSAFSLVQPK